MSEPTTPPVNQIPTKPGFYWVQRFNRTDWEPVEVFELEGKLNFASFGFPYWMRVDEADKRFAWRGECVPPTL